MVGQEIEPQNFVEIQKRKTVMVQIGSINH